MRVGFDGRQDRCRPVFPVGMDRLRPLHDTPAIVAAAFDAIDHFPEFPTHVSGPKITRLLVKTHAPGIAESVGPNLRARPWQIAEGIVCRDSIFLAFIRVVHVDAKNRGKEIAGVLAGLQRIGRIRAPAVAGRNVEVAVRTELQATAIVAARQPRDEDNFAGWIHARRIALGDRKPRDS